MSTQSRKFVDILQQAVLSNLTDKEFRCFILKQRSGKSIALKEFDKWLIKLGSCSYNEKQNTIML